MSIKKVYSTNSIPNARPIYVNENSVEAMLLDPKYLRIIDTVAPSNNLRIYAPSSPSAPEQFPEDFIAKNNSLKLNKQDPGNSLAIALDDIFLLSGPTSYMEGTNKKYEFVFKIVNSENLQIRDVEYRFTEIS